MRVPEATSLCLTAIAALLLICSGCTSEQDRVQSMEQMLAAAGFKATPITSDKQAQLAALSPRKLLFRQVRADARQTLGYVYSDPDVCHCVFVGDAQAYQKFSQLAFQKKLAAEYRETAAMAEDASFNWNMWAPGLWYPP
jgi:hypothetical protein